MCLPWAEFGGSGKASWRRGERQITRATYILLDELSVHHAGSRDQLVGIEVNEAVAGLHQEKRGRKKVPWV